MPALIASLLLLPCALAADAPPVVQIAQPVLPLPGGLNKVPVLNSNSPEVIQQPGIIVSTLPPSAAGVSANSPAAANQAQPDTAAVHLDYLFNGRFDVFLHHIARADNGDLRTLHVAVLLYNPASHSVKVDVLQGASYLSQPDAPFVAVNSYEENSTGTVFAGPGDRVMLDVLRGVRMSTFPNAFVIPPHQYALLCDLPIPVAGLQPPLNGRSLLARLYSHGPVAAVSAANFAQRDADGNERAPSAEQWQQLVESGALAGPREKPATKPGAPGPFAYGRVAGVSIGDRWQARLRWPATARTFDLAQSPDRLSFPISSVERGTLGSKQVQSAPLAVREPDTAFAAHGNYAVEYVVDAEFVNTGATSREVSVWLQTPLKSDDSGKALAFYAEPSSRVFFRGTVCLQYSDDRGKPAIKYIHVVQHQGEQGLPLVTLPVKPRQRRRLRVDFLYPPDATPPQALTLMSRPCPSATTSPAPPAQ